MSAGVPETKGQNVTTPVDMTKGMYRRIYSGFLNGKRINAVSEGAENWFWSESRFLNKRT
jgi:hypothetical protein